MPAVIGGGSLQVFSNLIGNAIKFSPEGATITVRAEPLGDELKYSVADTGHGIPAEQLPHLFERFWQATKTAQLGTGLGLSIAKGIVEAHGGRIWAESQVGVGSTFCFTLPRAPPGASQPVAREPESTSRPEPRARPGPEKALRTARASSPRRIVLVIDDDPDVRVAFGDTLEAEGYEVVPAANGAEALAYLRASPEPPFMMILDLNMPVMDGWSFLTERDRNPLMRTIPVLIVSGEANPRIQATALTVETLQKPVTSEGLLESMQDLADRAASGAGPIQVVNMRLSDGSLRGKTVIGADGHAVGDVAAVFLNSDTWSVESLRVKLRRDVADRIGASRTVFRGAEVEIPVGVVQSVSDAVVLSIPLDGLHRILIEPGGKGPAPAH